MGSDVGLRAGIVIGAPPVRAARRDPMPIAIVSLGLTQIITWGTTFYVLGVLGQSIGREMGWSSSKVLAGYAVALLIGSATSATAGVILDAYGARICMTAGSVAVALGLWALSVATDMTSYLLAWAYLGLAMRLTLYDAAFTALVQVAPTRGRRAISYLTLFGGFASTVFWPIGHYLNLRLGWRDTLALFALLNLVLCMPLHWFGISGTAEGEEHAGSADAAAQRKAEGPQLDGRARTLAITLFALVMTMIAFVFGVSSLQLVVMLEQMGLAATLAVTIASLKGVAQVGGRLVELMWGQQVSAINVSRISVAALAVSTAILVASHGSVALILAFTLLMGAAQGVISIVRGAVPLALFGPEGYGRVLGIISAPVMVMNACSPAIYAGLTDWFGPDRSTWALLLAATLALAAMEVMAAWYRRQAGG